MRLNLLEDLVGGRRVPRRMSLLETFERGQERLHALCRCLRLGHLSGRIELQRQVVLFEGLWRSVVLLERQSQVIVPSGIIGDNAQDLLTVAESVPGLSLR